jgi:hypothetical protein
MIVNYISLGGARLSPAAAMFEIQPLTMIPVAARDSGNAAAGDSRAPMKSLWM